MQGQFAAFASRCLDYSKKRFLRRGPRLLPAGGEDRRSSPGPRRTSSAEAGGVEMPVPAS